MRKINTSKYVSLQNVPCKINESFPRDMVEKTNKLGALICDYKAEELGGRADFNFDNTVSFLICEESSNVFFLITMTKTLTHTILYETMQLCLLKC